MSPNSLRVSYMQGNMTVSYLTINNAAVDEYVNTRLNIS